MEIKFIDTNLTYEIAEGMTLIKNYNDKLDTATVILSQLTSEIDKIRPYEEVVLIDPNGNIPDTYMCINNYKCTQINNYTTHQSFRYDIELISQTKLLELCAMPNIDTYNIVNHSIYDFMKMANDLYGQKKQLSGAQYVTNKWSFSSELITKFSAISCPEIYFNKPTLREFLNRLALYSDCLVTLNNNVISYIDISAKGTQLTNTPIYRTIKTMSGEDYLSNIKMDLSNVIGNNNIDKTLLPVGAGENAVINDTSLALYTEFPIYDVISFGEILSYSLIYTVSGSTTGTKVGQSKGNDVIYSIQDKDNNYYSLIDVLNEKQLFITKDVTVDTSKFTKAEAANQQSYKIVANYQNTTINYTRYSNKIDNLSCQTVKSIWDAAKTYTNVFNVINNCVYGAFYNTVYKVTPASSETYYIDHCETMGFEASGDSDNLLGSAYVITYKPVSFSCVKFYKDGINGFNADIIDNQEEAYLDPNALGIYENTKVKRLGNEIKLINGRIELPIATGVEFPYISDYFNDDEVIYQVEYEIFNNVIKYNLYTCKHYILKSHFTSVKSKLRSWRIVDGSEAFYRDENITHFFMFARRKLSTDEQYFRYAPLQNYTDTARMNDLLNIGNVVYCTDTADNCDYSKTFVKEVAKIKFNPRTITYNFMFADNYIGAKSLVRKTIYGGTTVAQSKYADDNGEVKKYRLDFYSSVMQRPERTENSGTVATDMDNWAKEKQENLRLFTERYPHTTDGIGHLREYNYIFSIIPEANIYKNNKEILRFTYQQSLVGDDDFILTDNANLRDLLERTLTWNIYKNGYTGDKVSTTATRTFESLISTQFVINKVSGYSGYIECVNSSGEVMMIFKQSSVSSTQETIYLLLKCFR